MERSHDLAELLSSWLRSWTRPDLARVLERPAKALMRRLVPVLPPSLVTMLVLEFDRASKDPADPAIARSIRDLLRRYRDRIAAAVVDIADEDPQSAPAAAVMMRVLSSDARVGSLILRPTRTAGSLKSRERLGIAGKWVATDDRTLLRSGEGEGRRREPAE